MHQKAMIFFLPATSKFNFAFITIFRISTFGVTGKQFFEKVIIFIYKMISNMCIVFRKLHKTPHLKKWKAKLSLKGTKKCQKTNALRKPVFFLFFFNFTHQKNIKISPMQYEREDTEVVVSLPENSEGYITSKFRTDEIEEISCREQRLWIGIWNKSLTKNIEVKKEICVGIFCAGNKSWYRD